MLNIHSLIKKIFLIFSSNKVLFKLFNSIYENSPQKLCWYLERYISPPKFNFQWRIKMPNGKIIKYPYVSTDPYFSFHFPLSYRRNDKLIRRIEILIDQVYPKDSIYFDVGANLGLRSLYYASSGRTIYMFEPNLKLKEYTTRMIVANNFTKLFIKNNLIGSKEGEIYDFHISASSYCSSVYHTELSGDAIDSIIKMESITLDKFIIHNNISDKVKIVKIDVEGFELDVFKGAMSLLVSRDIVILLEVLPTSQSKKELFDLLHEHELSIYSIDNKDGFLTICKDGFSDKSIDYLITNNQNLVEILKSKKLINAI